MSKKLKVFFNLRTSSRERMWDTAREASRVCEPITSSIKQQTSLERSRLYKKRSRAFIIKLRHIFKTIVPILNHQTLPKEAADADLIYMWGAFPRNSNKPFVIELDNPYVLTYYNQRAFRWRRSSLKKKLRKAKAITFLSETAKNHFIELLGQEFLPKCVVIPPFMKDRSSTNKRPNDGLVRFLFVGLGFRRKGGPELLSAFKRLDDTRARLTVVSPVPTEIRNQYTTDTRITFLPPQPRDVLFNDIYPTHDIFLFPSLLETLGVVILEAVSFGMGVITTDSYATPEMVKDNYNGRLLKHPFQEPVQLNGVMVIDGVTPPRETFQDEFMNEQVFYESMSQDILSALKQGMIDYTTWQDNSRTLFSSKYHSDRWEEMLHKTIY